MAVNRVDGIVDRLDLAVDRKLHRKLRRDPAVPCKIDQAATVTNFDLIDNFPNALHLPGHANGINAVLWFLRRYRIAEPGLRVLGWIRREKYWGRFRASVS